MYVVNTTNQFISLCCDVLIFWVLRNLQMNFEGELVQLKYIANVFILKTYKLLRIRTDNFHRKRLNLLLQVVDNKGVSIHLIITSHE